MSLWIIILTIAVFLLGISLTYIGIRIPRFFPSEVVANWTKTKEFLISAWIIILLMGSVSYWLNLINAFVCAFYLAMIWMMTDFVFWIVHKIFHTTFQHYYAGWTAIIIGVIALTIGWILNHYVVQTNYTLSTDKDISSLRIVMFADVHLGATFDAEGFQKHFKKMEKQKPDLITLVGDFVDDDTTKEEMIKACKFLGQIKTKYGIYFVLGNHDKGYYGAAHRGFSLKELLIELKKNDIIVLQDETVPVGDSFYLIGRKDFSEVVERKRERQSMEKLTAPLDKSKYIIVLDHQPADFKNQAKSEVDLVLCGHTHGNQLFPFNQVGKWIGANDLVSGYEKRNKTNFIVSSGISDWAIRFKTGTKSEFLVIDIKKNQ